MPYEKFNIIRGKPEETLQLWARKFEFLFNKNLNVDNVISTGLIVPADLVTVDDTGGYFASTNDNVEDVLQQIGSTLQNIPAGNVKIVDSGLYYTSTSVEGALQEVASTLRNNPSSNIYVDDTGGYYGGSHDLEVILQQIGSTITNLATSNLDAGFVAPLERVSTNIILNHSTVNLKVNASSQLDTIQDITQTASPTFANLTVTSTIQALTGKFGNSSDYALASSDGIQFFGQASQWHDELQSLLFQSYVNPAADIVLNPSDNSVTFTQACNINDYAAMNIQINHGWKVGSPIYPHLHWWQNSSNVPNWLIQYRWQYNGMAKQSAWTNAPRQSESYAFTAGSTINQISIFGAITPTSDAMLSDIVQFRLIRDGDNDSSAFATTDPLSGNVDAMNFDVHVEIDTLGSRQEYVK